MGKYERRTRPGMMLYHEDMAYLTALADAELASIVRFLADASVALAEGHTYPAMPTLCGFAGVTCKNMLEKLRRDHDKYLETCEKRRPNNGKGDLSRDEEGKGDFGTLTVTNNSNETSSATVARPDVTTMTTVFQAAKEADFDMTIDTLNKLQKYVDQYGIEQVLYGIRACSISNKCFVGYLEGVLKKRK